MRTWHPFRVSKALMLAAVLPLFAPAVAPAAEPPASIEALIAAAPALSKVSSHLLQARLRLERGADLAAADALGAVRIVPLVTERKPRIDVRLKRLDAGLLAHLEALGLEVVSHSERWARVDGYLDLRRLEVLAATPEVTAVHPYLRPITRTGPVIGQGDASINADDVRGTLGFDGTGVTVGILSDSFHNTLGGSESGGTCTCATPGSTCANVVTGMVNQGTDLPASVPILADLGGGGSDEGAALGEIVFDSAPDAAQMFHTAFVSESDFALGIDELVNCGADVIVDDAFFIFEPMFQDGPIAAAAQDAVDAGVSYFSAAGNEATFGIDDPFRDSAATDDETIPATGLDFHDFDPGAGVDAFAAVTIPEDCGVTFVLQWSEPFDGPLGPGAASDLDIYLCAPTPTVGDCTGVSVTRQGCGDDPGVPGPSGDPLEVATVSVSGGPGTVFLAVEHHCGDQGVGFRVATFPFGDGCGFPGTYDFEDGGAGETPIFVDAQIYGHPAAAGVVAVAATFFGEFDSGGTVDPPSGTIDVEPFSSLGGSLPFYFTSSGGGLSAAAPSGGASGPVTRDGPPPPVIRFKPEITGPDGTNNTFFGADIGFDPDFEPNFFGTSASAPHAAAIAALMQDAADNEIGPVPLSQILRQAAIDIETASADPLSGDGFVDGFKSVSTLDPFGSGTFLDELEFDLDGGSFRRPGATGQVKVRANKILFEDGDFSGIDAIADSMIFADGFESGDTSAWSSSSP